eukprot:6213413-Pleurochrysis_carterae.AAC.1
MDFLGLRRTDACFDRIVSAVRIWARALRCSLQPVAWPYFAFAAQQERPLLDNPAALFACSLSVFIHV